MIQIPLQPNPSRRFKIILAGQECSFWLYQKGRRMYLDLMVGQNMVAQGAICQNLASIVQVANPLFKGTLVFFDTEGDLAPFYEGLNTRFILLYFKPNEKLPAGIVL